ncbi:D-glycero-alpha-D-manno-heptose-1,7-bisphosphate 7-phosphatase [Actinomadura rubrisoli]|uniref:D,D-heptose 1,7-bisphosphate phosphatase n=1 Tax=Actinomadura rubrisoli TaxID=2530368 RepID=A0A4R5CD68_9ACTN|nr:HAD family hydrolase [Actinomadura rubrisoli]TDD96796.1 HAD family hydrolase [Actinomadura rubrisoli]
MTRRPAVFLDRDGVINDLSYDPDHGTVDSPLSPERFKLSDTAPEALRLLGKAGYALVVVSNQPAVAKGKMTLPALDAITTRMRRELALHDVLLDAVYYCLHHPRALLPHLRVACRCRKPEPGLLLKSADDLRLGLSASWMVGDGLTDLQAGRRAGCRNVWIGNWKCEHCQISGDTGAWPDLRAATLLDAARLITTERTFDADLH